MKNVHIIISGKVQGVFFRASTKATADFLGIRGWVKNLPDGTVEIEAEGDDFALGEFLIFCNQGPDDAVVEKVRVDEGQLKNYRNFEVLKKSLLNA
ncbi:MAG: acylphosphatase [Sphingobacteriaceae bacterium]